MLNVYLLKEEIKVIWGRRTGAQRWGPGRVSTLSSDQGATDSGAAWGRAGRLRREAAWGRKELGGT